MIRLLLSIMMLFGGIFLPFWYFVPCVFIYAFFYTSYDILLFAFLIDAGFGSGGMLGGYAYTTTVAVAMIATRLIRPYLRFDE